MKVGNIKRTLTMNRLFSRLKIRKRDKKLEERAKRSPQKWSKLGPCANCERLLLFDDEPCANCATAACAKCVQTSGLKKETHKCLKWFTQSRFNTTIDANKQ